MLFRKDHGFGEQHLEVRVLRKFDVFGIAGEFFRTRPGPDGQDRPPCAVQRGVANIVNPMMFDFRWQQTDPLGVIATNEATESAGDQHPLQIARRQVRPLQQNVDPGADRASGGR